MTYREFKHYAEYLASKNLITIPNDMQETYKKFQESVENCDRLHNGISEDAYYDTVCDLADQTLGL